MRILKTDPVSDRGQRMVAKGNVSLLRLFEFNSRNRITQSLYNKYVKRIDRASGKITVNIPGFIPKK